MLKILIGCENIDRNIFSRLRKREELENIHHLILSSFRTPCVEHTALPAPSVHHDCLQFTCISQTYILKQVVNISNFCLPRFACPSVGCHRTSLLATSSSCLTQCPASRILLCCTLVDTGGNSPYSCMLGMCCFNETLRAIRSILV